MRIHGGEATVDASYSEANAADRDDDDDDDEEEEEEEEEDDDADEAVGTTDGGGAMVNACACASMDTRRSSKAARRNSIAHSSGSLDRSARDNRCDNEHASDFEGEDVDEDDDSGDDDDDDDDKERPIEEAAAEAAEEEAPPIVHATISLQPSSTSFACCGAADARMNCVATKKSRASVHTATVRGCE